MRQTLVAAARGQKSRNSYHARHHNGLMRQPSVAYVWPSPNHFDITRPPALVEGGFSRTVEPENCEIAFPWHGGEPVGGLPCGCLGAEIKVGTAVGILHRFIP